jgi:hypothetical protein
VSYAITLKFDEISNVTAAISGAAPVNTVLVISGHMDAVEPGGRPASDSLTVQHLTANGDQILLISGSK